MHEPSTLQIRTLGAVRVQRDEQELSLGGAQPRLLLAFLVYARGRELSRRELVEATWGARPPERADVALRALVSRLWATSRLRAPVRLSRVRALRVTRLLLRGELAGAQEAMVAMMPLARELFPQVAAEIELTWSFVLARERGGIDQVRTTLETVLAGAPMPTVRAMLAEACALAGDLDGAAEQLAALTARDFADLHEDFLSLSVLSVAGTVAELLGDRRHAAQIVERLRPWTDRNVILGLAASHRPVAITLGALEHLLGDDDAALELLGAAEDQAAGMSARPWQADALYERGRVLLAPGRRSRRADGEAALTRAAEIADGYGGTLLA